jgi:glycosyltransferase involved in cell wall biosynthesis
MTGDPTAPVLSIIVTSYNIEDYLATCLDSIVGQTLDDIEIIIVDDGSSDRSPEIIADYAGRDDRIVPILLPENTIGGVATAANAGLDAAVGEYIGFVDGDDVYELDMFERLVSAARKHDTDLAMCKYRLLEDGTGELSDPAEAGRWRDLLDPVFDLTDVETAKQFLRFIAVPWRKIYRRSMVDEHALRFPVGDYFYEDNPFHFFSVLSARSIAVVPEVLCYHRVARSGQTMSTVDERLFKIFEHHETILRWLTARGLERTYGPTLLAWAIAQMEWISERAPTGLRAQLHSRLKTVFAHHDSADVEQSFRESGKGDHARQLARAVEHDDLALFNRVLDGTQRPSNPIKLGLHHLRYSGPKRTLQVTGRYLAQQGRSTWRRRAPNAMQRGSRDVDSLDLAVMLTIIDRRITRIEEAVKRLEAVRHEASTSIPDADADADADA